jgi:hypothetical protein
VLVPSESRSKKSSNDSCTRSLIMKTRVILVWNGYPAAGRGGTADIASYSRYARRPFLHVHMRLHKVKQHGSLSVDSKITHVAAKRHFAVSKQTVYHGSVLTVDQYQLLCLMGKRS